MAITQEQLKGYFAAEYRVFAPHETINLTANGQSPQLAQLHKSLGADSSAFITAYNPHGQQADEQTNRRQQVLLVNDVTEQWSYLQGEGSDPTGIWHAEPSLLVLTISLDDALSLGRKYQQLAILFSTFEGRTNLRACSPEDRHLLIDPT